MGRDVFIGAVGMVPFAKYRDRTLEDLGRDAVLAALRDGSISRRSIEEAFCGSGYGGPLVGQRVLRDLGMTGMPVTNVENACSSGATALREAATAIALGRCDSALAFGVDKLTQFGGGTVPLESTDIEVSQGLVMPALYAMRARRYMHETGATAADLAGIVVKSRRNAALNPYAQYRAPTTVDQVLSSKMIADPFTLFMCSPTADGAAAVVLGTEHKLGEWGVAKPIRIAASVLQSGLFKTGYRDMAHSELGKRSAGLAYAEAGVGPEDIDVAEVHDAFAIAELIYYEAFGFCAEGEGARFLASGGSAIDGSTAVNPSGGLLSRGHPIGPTGVAQVCEMVWHLRGDAGARQVPGAKVALTHCSGGGIAGLDHGASTVHILIA